MKKLNLVFIITFFVSNLFSQSAGFVNPIIPGGHPDPSICRGGDDFYIVNSSFEYFPALPVHHSKDLVNWELIGYGLHREEQASEAVNLVDVQQDGGIHAPTIRYYDGTFYIITTNVYTPADESKPTEMVNFIITATNPAGPWSNPYVIEGAPGIDPDLFFDDDGKAYFVGTHAVGQPNTNGIGEIWVQELDIENMKLTGKRYSLWTGACDGCCVEGPHIYKEHGVYYLIIAEGGTSYNHAVMISASRDIFGPYDSNPRNPILTSRHLSYDYWVNSTGHADLVQLQDGRWYMVMLGIRNEVEGRSNMGRETHLVPVEWEPLTVKWEEVSPGNWQPVEYLFPVASPETGRVERITPLPFPDMKQHYNDGFSDHFNSDKLNLKWNFRRVPNPDTYSLKANENHLRLFLRPENFEIRGRYGAIGFRQTESSFEYQAKMIFNPTLEDEEAGISIFQKDDNYINFTIIQKDGKKNLSINVKERGQDAQIVKQEVLPDYNGHIIFKLKATNGKYHYFYSTDDGESFNNFGETADDIVICHSYIGTLIGIYATSNGNPTQAFADFDWVSYKGFTLINAR